MPGEMVEAGQILATRMERFAGSLIDAVIGGTIGMALGAAMGIGLFMMGFDPSSINFRILTTVLGTALGACVFVALHGYLLSTKGQTIGKMVMKTKIVSRQGEMLPLQHLILTRYLWLWVVVAIPVVGPIVALANALMIFRENHQCLHDDIAGTKVVKA